MFVNTERQLLEYSFGWYVLNFAEMHNPHGAKWELRLVQKVLGEDAVYRAEFEIPSIPGSKLAFSFRVDDSMKGPPDVTFGEVTVAGIPRT